MSSSRLQAGAVATWTAGLLLLLGGTVQENSTMQRWALFVTGIAAVTTIHLSNTWLRAWVERAVTGMQDDGYWTRVAEQGEGRVTRLPRAHG